MSEYIVSARKYRPDSFESLIGQDNIAQTLKNSIIRGKLAHAYLFCGPRGVGKTTTARIFAKAINCSNPSPDMEPCGECESCRSFQEGRSYCIHELDAASNNGVDDIKNLMDQVQIPPQVGKYSVYIIDEVHMLSTAAFNAFLKTLEEPPAHAIFILATTEKHKILPTILSRCQTYDFNRISVPDIVSNLRMIAGKEGVNIDDESFHVMYQFLIGSVYLLPFFIFKGFDNFTPQAYFSWDTWRPILCLAVLCSSIAFSLWVGTIKKLGVAKSSIFTALIPVASAIIAWVGGHELLNLRQWIGVAVCAVGVIMSQVTVKARCKKVA